MKALRMAVRQFADDLAKIAQSWGVVPGFTFALLFANATALCKKRAMHEYKRILRISLCDENTHMSWSSVT